MFKKAEMKAQSREQIKKLLKQKQLARFLRCFLFAKLRQQTIATTTPQINDTHGSWNEENISAARDYSLPLHENYSCQSCERKLRPFPIRLPKWNNRRTLTLMPTIFIVAS